ncbi:hypothetical protein EH223_06935 [candidate division KSB1 bacterium]|nr:hypothetical protein [candidate division KSB1 bacterium]RQW04724.1 MAG: hypothetical protein EH223_06935 [candidate division KSB1 bacterium]
MKRTKKTTPKLTTFFFFSLVIGMLLGAFHSSSAQHLIATYTTSAPEATMFFLNPGYLNPAFGSGALGMHSNPAGLNIVESNRLSVAFGTSQSSTADFSYQAVDESDVYDPIQFDTQLQIKETGGLGAVGFAHRKDDWVFGIALMQARKGGFSFAAQGEIDVTTRFSIDAPITRRLVGDLPVDEIPMTWDVNTIGAVRLWSKPAEVSVAILPIMGGFSYEKGRLSLGAGLTYFGLKSNDDVGEINSEISFGGTALGRPQGTDPISGERWRGSVRADLDIVDQPFTARYGIDLKGHWFALSFGGMINYKLLSIGATYTHGFKGTVKGGYNLMTITTSDIPEDELLANVNLDLSLSPEIQGYGSLVLRDFTKDTLTSQESGTFKIGGYNSFSFGAHFLIFGAFASVDIPTSYPDIYSGSFGLYTEFPIPNLPVRFNTGIIIRSDGIVDGSKALLPLRNVAHLGGGLAFKVPVHEWLSIGSSHSWLRLGIRSSLTSFIIDAAESNSEDTTSKSTPKLSSAAFSFGLTVPF